MSAKLPESIKTSATPLGMQWQLPPVPVKRSIWEFIVGSYSALFFVAVAGAMLIGLVRMIFENFKLSWFLIPLLLVLIVLSWLFYLSLKQVYRVVTYWADPRSAILIGDEWLYTIERTWIFSSSKRYRIKDIQKIRVTTVELEPSKNSQSSTGNAKSPSDDKAEMPAQVILAFVTGERHPALIAYGYDRRLLESVAESLVDTLATHASAPKLEIEPLPQATDATLTDRHDAGIQKPATSSIAMLEDQQSVTFVLPPAGFVGGTRAMLYFGCFCLLIFGISAVFALPTIINGKAQLDGGMAVFAAFGIVGTLMILASIQNARAKSVFVISQSSLVFSQIGPFRTTEKQWAIATIVDIRADSSGVEITGVDLIQLQILLQGKRKQGLLTGRNPAELAWLAQELKSALKPQGLNPGVRA